MQLYPYGTPGVCAVRIEYHKNKSKYYSENKIINNEFPFLQYKGNGIFKKYKINNSNISNAPKIIEYSREKLAGIAPHNCKHPQ